MSIKIGKILGVLLSISIIVSGICMMVQCLCIYNSGDNPYTREAVAKAFGEISVPVFISIGLVIITFIYNFFAQDLYEHRTNIKNNDFVIKSIHLRKSINEADNINIKKERRIRKTHSLILTILLIVGFSCFGLYAFDPSNFHQSEINASMIRVMVVFCICIALPFIYSIVCISINDRSRQREINILRELIKDAQNKEPIQTSADHKPLIYVKISAIVLCVGIIIYGLFSGGTADVLTKAINICTECIGLG